MPRPGKPSPLRRSSERLLARIPTAVRALSLLALAVCAFAYPLQLSPPLFEALFGPPAARTSEIGIGAALRAWCQFAYSPLVLKEVLATWCILLMILLWVPWKLFADRRRTALRPETAAGLLFFLYAALSVLRAPHFGVDAHSLHTALNFCLWSLLGTILVDLPPSPRFRNACTNAFLAIAAVLMLISVAEAVDPLAPYVFQVLRRTEGLYYRNLYGSLIGHNTGVAAVCLGPFFFALGRLFLARRPLARVLLALYCLLAAFFFVVTQSRSIWILAACLTPLFLLGLRSAFRVPVRLRHFLVAALVCAALIFSQTDRARRLLPGNFLHIEKADFQARLRAMSPAILLQGTRLRILAVSEILLASHPLLGHGLGAFTIVYPKAQAEYFAAHPRSVLRPTILQANAAHNEYLQLLVETGLLGALLAAAAAVLFLRRARRRYRALPPGEEKQTRYCAAFALLAVALHSFADFPLHIAPLATFFVFYLVLLYGKAEEDPPPPGAEHAADAPAPAHPRVRAVVAACLCAAVLLLLAAVFQFTGSRLRSDRFFCKGVAYYLSGLEMPDTADYPARTRQFATAREYLRQSNNLFPLEFLPLVHLALCDIQIANLHAQQMHSPQARAKPELADALRKMAISSAILAIDELKRTTRMAVPTDFLTQDFPTTAAIGPRINHTTFYALARAWSLVETLQPDHPRAAQLADESLRTTVRYAPSLAPAVAELVDRMDRRKTGSLAHRKALLQQLCFFDPKSFSKIYRDRAVEFRRQGQPEKAILLLRNLLQTVPNPEEVPELAIELAWLEAHFGAEPAAFETLLRSIEAAAPADPQIRALRTILLVLQKQYAAAAERIDPIVRAASPGTAVYWEVLRTELDRARGRTQPADAAFNELVGRLPFPSEAYALRGAIRRGLHLPPAWEPDFQTALQYYPPNYDAINLLLPLLRARAQARDWPAFDALLALGRARFPGHPELERQASELRPE